MSKMQRTKGANGENEVCKLLTDWTGFKVKRNLGQARDGGNDVTLAPFTIEVKRRKRIASLYDWIEQAQKANRDSIPVVALRSDNEKWLVVMRFTDWIGLAREEIVITQKEKGNGKLDRDEAVSS